jgi:histidinol-phosphatase (PHP family)
VIDSHSHTQYSKHARGTVDELVRSAIARGVSILTITDHAPFPLDRSNRLLRSELNRYFEDVNEAKHHYAEQITVLAGLESDYSPGYEPYLAEMLGEVNPDFVIGSIHYVFVGERKVNVWDLQDMHHPAALEAYFDSVRGLLGCGLFDAVGHVDTVLRTGMGEDAFLLWFRPLMPLMIEGGVSYEINASGARKSILDSFGVEVLDGVSYPSRRLVAELELLGASFTIGSDAHRPEDVGAGLVEVLHALGEARPRHLSWYEGRCRREVLAEDAFPQLEHAASSISEKLA